jgi:hypothetical protein
LFVREVVGDDVGVEELARDLDGGGFEEREELAGAFLDGGGEVVAVEHEVVGVDFEVEEFEGYVFA